MSSDGGVSADELLRALERQAATLPSEIGTFVILEACEVMLSSGSRELVGLSALGISEQGAVSIAGPSCDEGRGARSLHRALVLLLRGADPDLPPLVERLATGGPRLGDSLRGLRDELEAALVPLNRTASRRVLARYAREAASILQDGDSGGRAAVGHAADLRGFGQELGRSERPGPHETRSPSIRPSFAPGPPDTTPGERPSELRFAGDEGGAQSAPAMRRLFWIAAAAAVAVLLVIFASLGFRDALPTPAGHVDSSPVAATGGGRIEVTVNVDNAQVLRFLGLAPLTVSNLAVGVAHEFVAIAEGHETTRVLVPAQADWEAHAAGPRLELALQLSPRAEGAEELPLELGPSQLSGAEAAGARTLGSARIVTSPRGARVYQVVGFSPLAVMDSVPVSTAHELLVYRAGYAPVTRVVGPSDFLEQASGAPRAALRVELLPRP